MESLVQTLILNRRVLIRSLEIYPPDFRHLRKPNAIKRNLLSSDITINIKLIYLT